jgi:hypothetical protein
MGIDLVDLSYLSDHHVAKMQSWLVNVYTGLTERLTPIEKLMLESAPRDLMATATFPGLITQYHQLLGQLHTIYKLAQEEKSQFERMSYVQYALFQQTTLNSGCQVDGSPIAIREESQESFTQMQNVLNTQITNVGAMQQQTELFARRID